MVTIQIFSDYVCPFCRLAEVAAKQAAVQTGAQLVWRAHQLRQDGPPRLDPQGAALTQGWRATIYPLADRLGLAIRQPSRLPLTRYAHEAAAWARTQIVLTPFTKPFFTLISMKTQTLASWMFCLIWPANWDWMRLI